MHNIAKVQKMHANEERRSEDGDEVNSEGWRQLGLRSTTHCMWSTIFLQRKQTQWNGPVTVTLSLIKTFSGISEYLINGSKSTVSQINCDFQTTSITPLQSANIRYFRASLVPEVSASFRPNV